MRTIAELIRWRAARHPALMATWFEGRTRSYGALNRSSSELAAGLVEKLGLQPGDRVAILDKNSDAYLELLFALDKAGLVAAPVNRRLTPHEIGLIIADIGPRLIVAGEEFAGHCAGVGAPCLGFDELPRGGADPHRDVDGAVTWQFSTSGTTGLPKGAMLTGWNVLNAGACFALETPEYREGGPSLICMPMFHLAGAGVAIWGMQLGASLVILREIAAPDILLQTITQHRIETAHLVPAVLHMLCELPEAGSADFSHFQHVGYGTAPIAPDLLRRAIALLGCKFTQFYGLTETTGPFAALPFEHHHGERLASCGRPMFGGRARIVGADGQELPRGEIGEIAYRGENLMVGYWRRPDATAEAIRGGWFHTGDAGLMDADGFIFIKDRIKDMIVSGGENVYPAEIEALLASHPEIAEAAVIGVPDAKWGEAVKAVVVARPGSALTAEALIAWTGGRLAGYKRPRSVDFVDALPRNASGKLLKRVLREPYWRGKDRGVN
jgi:acyl-CoA synthetase (AMP-forming)/AMP-acid ligase II